MRGGAPGPQVPARGKGARLAQSLGQNPGAGLNTVHSQCLQPQIAAEPLIEGDSHENRVFAKALVSTDAPA